MFLNIKPNGTFDYQGTTYHKNQYTIDNPLYNESNPAFNDKYIPLYKHLRSNVIPLYNIKGDYIVIPKRINAVTQSTKEANKNYKNQVKVYNNKSLYRKVIRFFLKRLAYYLVKTGADIQLPYVKLGSIRMCQNKQKSNKFINFKESKIQGKTVWNYTKHWVDSYKPVFVHFDKTIRVDNDKSVRTCNLPNSNHYKWTPVRQLMRPNSYNTFHHELTILEFFKTDGYKFYHKLD